MAMANYVLSYAFSDQIFLIYARAALDALGEVARQTVEKILERHTRARRERALRRALSTLNERSLRDIGLA